MSNSPRPVLRRSSRRSTGWAFIAPYTVFLVAFGIIPVGYAIVTSFTVTPVIGSSYLSLVQNYADVLSDFRLPQATLNVASYLVVWLPAMILVVFVLALVMDAKRTRFVALTRFIVYVPGAITGSAATLLWFFMFSPQLSPFSSLLQPFTPKGGSFINDHSLVVILAVMGIAIGSGGWLVLLLGALTAIPSEVIESATIDGANPWQMVWYIKLPLIRSYIAFILIVSFAAGFQVFVEPTVLANGALGQVSSTWSINQLVFSYATGESNYGRASALALMLLVVCVAVAVLVLTRTNFYDRGTAKK